MARLRKEVRVAEQQFGFMPGRSTTDAHNIQSADAAGEVERRAEGGALCVCGSRKGL